MDKLLSSWQDMWSNERAMPYLGVVAAEEKDSGLEIG